MLVCAWAAVAVGVCGSGSGRGYVWVPVLSWTSWCGTLVVAVCVGGILGMGIVGDAGSVAVVLGVFCMCPGSQAAGGLCLLGQRWGAAAGRQSSVVVVWVLCELL